MTVTQAFTQFANMVSRITGRAWTFIVCIALVAVWAATGPIFHYSDTWQLIINTSTTIITFLMVFLIQNTQNRDNAALQAKLDELIRISEAENRYIGIEKLTDTQLESILEEVEQHAEVIEDTGTQSEPAAGARAKRRANATSKKKTATRTATRTRKRA
ncbi:MAG TPA: low affinity iron permease family protein [Caulobacteraceae bacterium]|nr:low affinity iron permease family protein [Caulobacteraceae bacterium]